MIPFSGLGLWIGCYFGMWFGMVENDWDRGIWDPGITSL